MTQIDKVLANDYSLTEKEVIGEIVYEIQLTNKTDKILD